MGSGKRLSAGAIARACTRRRRLTMRQSWILLSDDPPAFDSDPDDLFEGMSSVLDPA